MRRPNTQNPENARIPSPGRSIDVRAVDAAVRLAILIASLVAIAVGVHLIAGPGAALVVCGGLVWLDLTKESKQDNEHDSEYRRQPTAER